MDDDGNRHEVDARLREILKPPAPTVARVVSAALRGQQPRLPMPRWRWAAATAAGLAVVGAMTWQLAGPHQPTIPATTAAPRSGGHYVIVVPALEVAP
jgi:hypothetical protein